MALKNVVIGYAKGDKGDKGDTGERGATGQTGPQGESGNIADAEITDTQGLDVDKGAKTTAQKLFDAITDRIVNKLVSNEALTEKLASYLLKSAMSSTNINSASNVPTSALLYSLMSDVNNNLSKIGAIKYVFIESVNGNDIMEVVKNSYNAGKIPYNSAILGMISYSGMWGISGYTYPTGQNYCSFILHKYDRNEIVHVRNENGNWNVS